MRVAIFLTVFVACAFGYPSENEIQPRTTANINQYVDILLKQVDKFIVSKGLDPMQMEDIKKSFSVKPIIITYHGELDLTHGWLQGLSKMSRGGDAEMSYEAMFLNIKLPLQFENLLVDFDYTAKLMDLSHSGAVDAKITNLHLYIDITIDTKTLEISLQEFKITDAGKIDVNFSGNPLIDWLANALTDVVTTLFHDLVQSKIEVEVKALLQNAIDEINNKIPGPNAYATDDFSDVYKSLQMLKSLA